MSRGFGNFKYKANKDLPSEEQVFTADPDVTYRDVSEEDEFLVLACDGSFFFVSPRSASPL
jgi:protein phosphatase PTC2/3